jgi:multidrug resistance efflux pump
MIKKIGILVIFLVAVICLSAPLFAEDQPAAKTEPAVTQEPMPAAEELLPEEEATGEGVITGEVTSLDTATGAITVKGDDGAEKSFSVVEGETILWKGIEDIKLADIKKGDKAEVGYYTDDAGKLIASWVDVIVPEQPAASGAPAAAETETSPAIPDEE